MIDHVKNEVTKILMTVQVQSSAQLGEAAQQLEARAEHITSMTYTAPTETGEAETTSGDAGSGIDAAAFEGMRVGRNDPCPCGSGKNTNSATASWPDDCLVSNTGCGPCFHLYLVFAHNRPQFS